MMPRVALYARVSTERQAEQQTIVQQVERLEAEAQQRGWAITPAQIYRDDGVSGARLDRSALDRLRDAVGQGQVDILLIASPDRLARRYAYQVWLLEEFERAGCSVIFLDRPPTGDPQDALVIQIRGVVAEYERAVIADRMRRGRVAALRAGRLLPWSTPPLGYRVDPRAPRDPAGVQVDEAGAAIVRDIYTWYAEDGLTRYGIAQRLSDQHVPTPTGRAPWSPATIRKVLTNAAYQGIAYGNQQRSVPARRSYPLIGRALKGPGGESVAWRPPEEWVGVPVPALISTERFAQAQARLAQNRQRAPRNTRGDYLLRCLVSCRQCGLAHLVWNNGRYAYYRCKGLDGLMARRHPTPCRSRQVATERLDALVWGVSWLPWSSAPRSRLPSADRVMLRDALPWTGRHGGGGAVEGGLTMFAAIRQSLRRHARAFLRGGRRRLLALLKPATGTPGGGALADLARTKAELVAENALLRQQFIVLRRQVRRPVLTPADRCRLVLLARLARGWRATLLIVQPDTLLRWHRQGFRALWRARSAAGSKRPQVAADTVALIQRLAAENRLWGAERIRGELLKLGIGVGKRTVQRHMRTTRPPRAPAREQAWATFVRNHAEATWACDFLQVVDFRFRSLCAFFIVELGSRRVVHVGVTRHPTDAWVAQQLREATPFGAAPRFLIRDNDRKYGAAFARVATGSRIAILRTPVRAPRANATCERFLGSVRRECLDHMLVLGERHLRRVLREYVVYFNGARPHQGKGQVIPEAAGPAPPSRSEGHIVSSPVLGGLHHDYRRAA